MSVDPDRYRAPAPAGRPILGLLVLGVLAALGGALVDPARVWANGLLVFVYLVGLALGALFFVGAHHVAGARWTVAFRRIPEAMSGVLPWALIGVGAVLIAGLSQYAFHAPGGHGAATTFWFKAWWLSPGFLVARTVVYALVWLAFARVVVATSRSQDLDGSAAPVQRNTRQYAAFLVVFAITFSLASFDWLMALRAEWFSTIFAAYQFAGAFTSAIAAIILLGAWCHRRGALPQAFTDDHRHDLGKLLLGFTCFWMYCWFSQYMLIWYSHLPEETIWFIPQTQGPWEPIFIVNLVVNWAIPFLVLLPRGCKRSERVLTKVAILVLVGRWFDLYLVIFPAAGIDAATLSIWDVGLAAGGAGLFAWAFGRTLRRAATVPLRDPHLSASLHHHVA